MHLSNLVLDEVMKKCVLNYLISDHNTDAFVYHIRTIRLLSQEIVMGNNL